MWRSSAWCWGSSLGVNSHENIEPVALGYCHCRCGQSTSISQLTMEPNLFINGHNRRADEKLRKTLTVVCANTTATSLCPRGGVPFKVTGRKRKEALRRGLAYCCKACADAGKSANQSIAQTARFARLSPADAAEMAKLVAQDGIARIPLRSRTGQVRAYALVDADLEPILSAFTWHLELDGYACRIAYVDGKKTGIKMHRVIMEVPSGGIPLGRP
jgi:hypothetical protein